MERLFFLFIFDTNDNVVFQADKIISSIIGEGYRSHNGFIFESDKTFIQIKETINLQKPDELLYILIDISDNCSEEVMSGYITRNEYIYAKETVALIKKYRKQNVFTDSKNLSEKEIQKELDFLLDIISKKGLDFLSHEQKLRLNELSQKVENK